MWEWAVNYEPQVTEKFFDPAIFQKCWRGVGEQPTFAKQITKPNNEMKQKSKRESKESQLPSKSEGCNERQGFRGNCDSQGKLGMCPSLAEPDASGFPKKNLLLGKRSFASGKNRSALLPLCGSPVAALSELSMNRSPIPVFWNYFCFLEWRTAVSSCSSIFLFSHQYVC